MAQKSQCQIVHHDFTAYRVTPSGHPFCAKEALWPCQTDIAEAYGLPGTTEGLQRIQNEVQRAITEGANGLRVGGGGDDDGLGR